MAATIFLGKCYENGHGVEQNYAEAVRCYKLAAEKGYAQAITYLGSCSYLGFGVERDYEKAFRLRATYLQ